MHSQNKQQQSQAGRESSTPFPHQRSSSPALDQTSLAFEILPSQQAHTSVAAQLEALPASPRKQSIRQTLSYLITHERDKPTGLEHLPLRDFMALAKEKLAFAFATTTSLSWGWWSSLLQARFLKHPDGKRFCQFLENALGGGRVLEIGARDQAQSHRKTLRQFGVRSYVAIDLQDHILKHGGIQADALPYLASLPSRSLDAIMAFGVFNEPMSMLFPAAAPPHFLLPARKPQRANRCHCEHEYTRRLAREIMRVLKPGGLLFGDGLHSRGFEMDVRVYLRRAGLEWDKEMMKYFDQLDRGRHKIRDPFVFRKLEDPATRADSQFQSEIK